MTLLPLDPDIEAVLGTVESAVGANPLPPFSREATAFLAALSSELMKDRDARRMPDLVSFGYWCRRSNLDRMSARYPDTARLVGRGVAFHIPPSNVPLNFAYSLACGLLSGNANIVRLSSTPAFEVDRLVAVMKQVLEDGVHSEIRRRICLLRYGHNDDVTARLSAVADTRIIWGGDRTVQHIRSIPAKPRTVDVAFADRVSVSMIDARYISTAESNALESAAEKFYVDAFTFSQNACSSPRLVIWFGSDIEVAEAKLRFWSAVDEIADRRGEIEPIHVMNRFVELCEMLIGSDSVSSVEEVQAATARIRVPEVSRWQETSSLRFGTFVEVDISDVNEAAALLDSKVQTVAILGFEQDMAARIAVVARDAGVDRVVAAGNALNFDLIWDGYDLIATLTRAFSAVHLG